MGRLLAATAETQGKRKSDFHWVPEGEYVFFGFECDRDRRNIDGGCGCRRGMCGIECHRATTTFKVVECADEDVEKFRTDLSKFYKDNWHFDVISACEEARVQSVEIKNICDTFPVGTILEKRGNSIRPRR